MKPALLFLLLAITASAQVICPECQKLGKKSTVDYVGSTSTPLASAQSFDSDGNALPYRDQNTYTSEYRCSNGHAFAKKGEHVTYADFGSSMTPKGPSPLELEARALIARLKAAMEKAEAFNKAREPVATLPSIEMPPSFYEVKPTTITAACLEITGLKQSGISIIQPKSPSDITAILTTEDGKKWKAEWKEIK